MVFILLTVIFLGQARTSTKTTSLCSREINQASIIGKPASIGISPELLDE